jgi:hypothetical protein
MPFQPTQYLTDPGAFSPEGVAFLKKISNPATDEIKLFSISNGGDMGGVDCYFSRTHGLWVHARSPMTGEVILGCDEVDKVLDKMLLYIDNVGQSEESGGLNRMDLERKHIMSLFQGGLMDQNAVMQMSREEQIRILTRLQQQMCDSRDDLPTPGIDYFERIREIVQSQS